MKYKSALFILAGIYIASSMPSADAASIFRKYSYYNITGKTAKELDRSLAKNGPFIQSTGQRHPGASRIELDAKIHYGREDGKHCKIENAQVNVHAKVFIPRWVNRKRAEPDIALIWDTLVSDIKRHEESHIIIARKHASELEQQAKKLFSRKDCEGLRADIDRLIEKTLDNLNKEQAYFDKVEAINFENRFERLLSYRLEKVIANAKKQ